MEKKEKKGFWASLFASKPCKCSQKEAYTLTPVPTVTAAEIKEIKVLGPGCAKCKSTYTAVEKVLQAHKLNIKLTKVEDIEEILRYNIMATPAVVVDSKVVMRGKVPTVAEIEQMLGI